MSEAKPYVIPKQLVWEAYQRVKANQGSAGVDPDFRFGRGTLPRRTGVAP
jgi:hypothetical protein